MLPWNRWSSKHQRPLQALELMGAMGMAVTRELAEAAGVAQTNVHSMTPSQLDAGLHLIFLWLHGERAEVHNDASLSPGRSWGQRHGYGFCGLHTSISGAPACMYKS